ncbi:hypothetical protein AB0J57_15035 [Streptomyces sp. NPDC049837]|uniref:hypothetical protein n=1 Tax=Streptomyces sp. NPDC049837 TaxID=3155277 RepID=UPI003442F849
MRGTSTGRLLAVALISATVGLVGCSSSGTEDRTEGTRASEAPPVDYKNPPEVESVPQMRGSRNLELPLEAYTWTDAEERVRRQGEDRIAAECMRGFGFDLEPRPLYRGDKALRDANRYGVSDMASASRFGYNTDPYLRGKRPEEHYTPAESLALFGPQGDTGQKTAKAANGKAIPEGGCWGQALRELASKGPKVHPDKEEFASHLALFAYQESQKDKRVQKAFADWSACMKAKGYHYNGPMAPVEDERFAKSTTPTPAEIRVAEADVECKEKHNVIGTWYAVEVAYQKRAIESNQQMLDTLKQRKDAILRAASASTGR